MPTETFERLSGMVFDGIIDNGILYLLAAIYEEDRKYLVNVFSPSSNSLHL